MKRILYATLTLSLLAAPTAAFAQANDVGAPAVPRPSTPPTGPVSPGLIACPAGVVSTQFSGTNTQNGRIFRDAIPSTCPSKAYPGIFNPATPYYYETFTYPNVDAATTCVTVNFDPNTGGTPCGTDAHASAYLNSYDPANQATNYVGDVGSSITDSFSFDVPGMQNLVLVVTNTAGQNICTFAFGFTPGSCVAPVPVAGSSWGLAIMMTLLLMAAAGSIIRMRRAQA